MLSYIFTGIREPKTALAFALSGKRGANLVGLQRLLTPLGARVEQLREFYKELDCNVELAVHINKILSGNMQLGQLRAGPELYVIVRALRPRKVLETGVAAGVSSTYILQALADNESGRLYSVDIPNYELEYFPKMGKDPVQLLPQGLPTGFAIPDRLRSRWELRIGRSREALPSLLDELGEIDLFLHDSEHTYEGMMFEFRVAWPHLGKDGVLLADDVFWNRAFSNFARTTKKHCQLIHFTGLGGIVK